MKHEMADKCCMMKLVQQLKEQCPAALLTSRVDDRVDCGIIMYR